MINDDNPGWWDCSDIDWLNTAQAYGKLDYQLTLEQYAPEFTVVDTDATRSGPLDSFDACVATNLIRAFSDSGTLTVDTATLSSVPTLSFTEQTLATNVSGLLENVSLVSDGVLTARLFYSDGSNIKYYETTDGGLNWGAAQTVGAVSDVHHLAATDLNTVHYTHETSSDNYRLAVYEYNGSWSNTESHIRWPIPIDQMDAERLSDGKDLIVMVADLPPLIGHGVSGGQLTWEANRVSGLVSFIYDDGVWSDHLTHNVTDRYKSLRSRKPRLSEKDDTIFITYEQTYGESGFVQYDTISCIRTKDGKSFELPAVMDNDLGDPAKIVFNDAYAFLVNSKSVARSPITAYFGDPVDEVTEDISDHLVGLQSNIAQIRSTRMRLSNPDDVLRNPGTLLSQDRAMQVDLKLGYWNDAGVVATSHKGVMFIGDVAKVERTRGVPKDQLELTMRGRLELLRIIKASDAYEWPSQELGGDIYYDPGDTDYGGLRHTATREGHWTTEDNKLILHGDNEEGLAFTTVVADMWCGEISVAFKVTESSEGEYAGIAFWAHDRQHLWYAYYDADNDVIKLVRRGDDGSGGDAEDENTVKDTSSSMGWSPNTTYYMKVITNYAEVKVYSSTDGESWTLEITYERAYMSDSVCNYATTDNMPILSGHAGVIALGYLAEEEYTPPEDGGPEDPPDPNPPNWEGVGAALVYNEYQVGFTDGLLPADGGSWGGHGPSWQDVTGNLSGKSIIKIIYNQTSSTACGAWAMTRNNLYYADNILTSDITWDYVISRSSLFGEEGYQWHAFVDIITHSQNPDYLLIKATGHDSANDGHAITTDRGNSWTQCVVGNTARRNPRRGLCIDENNWSVWTVVQSPSSTGCVYHSTDGGYNFSKIYQWSLGWAMDEFTMPISKALVGNHMVLGTLANVRHSSDGGNSFSSVHGTKAVSVVNWTYDDEIWWFLEGYNQSDLYKSTDGGASWTLKRSNTEMDWVGGWPGDKDIVFLVRGDNAIQGVHNIAEYTDDAGSNWYDLTGDWFGVLGSWPGGHSQASADPSVGMVVPPRIGANAPSGSVHDDWIVT